MTFKQLLKKVTNCSETNIPKWEGSGFAFFERFCANIWWCVTYHFQSDYLFFVTKAVKKMSRREVIFGKIGFDVHCFPNRVAWRMHFGSWLNWFLYSLL